MKLEKISLNNLEKKLPKIFIFGFLIAGIAVLGFVYYLFNREPQANVVSDSQKDLNSVQIKFDKKKIETLLESKPAEIEVKNPDFEVKPPFSYFR